MTHKHAHKKISGQMKHENDAEITAYNTEINQVERLVSHLHIRMVHDRNRSNSMLNSTSLKINMNEFTCVDAETSSFDR